MLCQRCLKDFDPREMWNLMHVGFVCNGCAYYILAYWKLNLNDIIRKFQARVGQKVNLNSYGQKDS